MGAASATNVGPVTGEAAASYPTVAVSPSTTTAEVGFGNTVTITAQASTPVSGATLSYKWSATYSVNPGGSATVTPGTPATTATVTMPTLTQALAGVAAPATTAYNGYNGVSAAVGSGVPAYQQENRIGILPILADTRGSVSTTVTVSDGLGGSVSASVSSNAAGTQTGLNNVPVGEPVYLNSGYSTPASNWALTPPSGSKAALTGATTRNAWFVPDVAGTYVVKDSANTATKNTLTIYAGTWQGVIKGGGATKATVPATGFGAFTAPSGGVSQLNVGVWAGAAGTYTDWPYVTVDTSCTACHANNVVVNGLTAPDKFTPWTATAHATFFSRGLENITSNSGTCLTCHTVGYDQAPGANNGGFDDVALLDGWAYPTKQSGQWVSMLAKYPYVAQLANIQCENCHGPQQSGGHISGLAGSSTGIPGGTRVSYSAEDCAICHADATHHHLYSEWVASLNPGTPGTPITINAIAINGTTISPTFTNVAVVAGNAGHGHSNLGQFNGTGYTGHATSNSPSCSRCHTAEGFAAYVTQLMKYTGQSQVPSVAGVLSSTYVPNSIVGGNGSLLGTTVWTPDNAHTQTCTACHDPHNDANPNQLRVYDSVPMTIVGAGVSGLGKGAICAVCHNSRNGVQCDSAHAPLTNGTCASGSVQSGPTFLHEDTDLVAPTYMDTPHDNTQAEVLLGRDAFFMGTSLPMLSKHANVQDSCVGCHMTLNPQMNGTSAATHVFYIQDGDRPTLCANCHGGSGDVSGQGIVSETQNQEAVLTAALGLAMQTHLPANTTIYVGKTAVNTASVASVTFFQIPATSAALTASGSATFYFYNSAGTLLASGGLSAITTDAAGLLPVFSTNGILKRAVWNYQLIGKDYSNGIHNPSFVNSVLSNTINAVNSGYYNPLTNTALPY